MRHDAGSIAGAGRCTDVTWWRRAVLAAPALTATAKVVALVLAEHMDWSGPDAGANCWPSLDTIEEASGLARRSVTRSLEKLAGEGWLERGCRRGCRDCRGGNGHVASYAALVPPDTQQGHHVPAEQGHHVPADGPSGEPSRDTTSPPAGTSVHPAGTPRPRQQGHHVPQPSLDQPDLPTTTPSVVVGHLREHPDPNTTVDARAYARDRLRTGAASA